MCIFKKNYLFLMIWVLLNNVVVLYICVERDIKLCMWFYNLFNYLILWIIYKFFDFGY